MKKKIRYVLPRKQYFYYLLLIVFTFVIFVAYAFIPEDFNISITLHKMTIPHENVAVDVVASQSAQHQKVESVAQDTVINVRQLCIDTSAVKNIYQEYAWINVSDNSCFGMQHDTLDNNELVDTTKQRFLLIGDSMSEFLRIRLNDYCTKNGHTCNTVIWYSSSTEWYGSCDTLQHFINKYHPTYVLISLGGNELFIKNIAEKRESYVKRILAQIGNIPYVWIGPPNWKPDTGINDLIASNVGDGHYFESKRLEYERCKDGAHPVKSSAYNWMDHIAYYLYHNAAHRVIMERPDKYYEKIPSTAILSPNPPHKNKIS